MVQENSRVAPAPPGRAVGEAGRRGNGVGL